jgi:hypothetical protein
MKFPNNAFFAEPPPTSNHIVVDVIKNISLAVAFTMSSEITAAVFRQISPYQDEIVIQPRGIRIPIFESFNALSTGHSTIFNSFVYLVKKEKVALVWAPSVESVLPHGSDIESKLLGWVSLSPNQSAKRELILLYRCRGLMLLCRQASRSTLQDGHPTSRVFREYH